MIRPPPGLPFPVQTGISGHEPVLTTNGSFHSLPPLERFPHGDVSEQFACQRSVVQAAAPAETPARKASARTTARALLRAKARARRREANTLQSKLTESSPAEPLADIVEHFVEDTCARARSVSLGSQVCTETTASNSESDSDIVEVTTPTSSSSTATSTKKPVSDAPSYETELVFLRATLLESERENFEARSEVLALRLQLEQAQLVLRMHAEERERLEAHNVLLMKELRDVKHIGLAPQTYSQLAFSPASSSGHLFDQRVADVFPPQLCLGQAMQIITH